MFAQYALAQNEGVLRAYGHDQSQAGRKAGKYVIHAFSALYRESFASADSARRRRLHQAKQHRQAVLHRGAAHLGAVAIQALHFAR